MVYFFWRTVLGIGLAACLSAVATAEDTRDDKFFDIALDILAGLDKVQHAKRPKGASEGFAKLRVAIRPFDQEKIKLSKEVADEFNDAMYAALLQQAGARYRFIARQKLTEIITDMQQTGAWEASARNPINALMVKAQKVDVLITGKIRMSNQTAFLRYSAVGMDAEIIAQTAPYAFKLSREEAKIRRPTVSLEQAVQDATASLSDQVHDLEELLLGGIRFEDSGAQPGFGHYLQGRLSSAMQKAFSNAALGKQIKVNPLDGYSGYDRGIDIKAKQLVAETPASRDKTYVLRGKYWELPGSIELRVNLKGANGASASWLGHIQPDAAAGHTLRPRGNFGALRDNDGLGPFAFHLTSNRGEDAAYRFGENLNLLIRLDRDAWTYCFYKQSNGSMFKILPNSGYKKALLRGNVPHMMGDGRSFFPFKFTFGPPAGTELVKCFAVSRDITNDLPRELRGWSFDPLPQHLASTLPSVFQRLPNAAVSEASFVVTVNPKNPR